MSRNAQERMDCRTMRIYLSGDLISIYKEGTRGVCQVALMHLVGEECMTRRR
jgi:hypothetical protein